MCGIVGVLSSEGIKGMADRKKVFTQSLYTDALRGFDSTGIIMAGGTKKVDSLQYKRALPASDFLTTKKSAKIIADLDEFNFIIGHNRFATKGGVSDDTAHPFDFDNVVGVHNGTLTSTFGLKSHNKYDVDSEALYHDFDEVGHEETVPKLQGAFALAWYDKLSRKFHLVRNEERPLFIAEDNKSDTIYLASEKEMLNWILTRNKIDFNEIKDIGVGKLLTFTVGDIKGYEESSIDLHEKEYYGNWYSRGNYKNDNVVTYNQSSSPEALRDYNSLKVGMDIDFIIDKILPYSGKSGNCSLEGTLEHNAEINVQVYGVDHSYIIGEESNIAVGKIRNLSKVRGDYTVTLDPNTVLVYEDQEVIDVEADKAAQLEDKSYIGSGGHRITKMEWTLLTECGCSQCKGPIEPGDSGKLAFDHAGMPVCPDCVKVLEYEQFIPTIKD